MAPPQPRQAELRVSIELFLRAHPAVGLLLRGFLRALLLRQPDDVLEFAAEYFTHPELPGRIQEELRGLRAAGGAQKSAPRPGGV